MTTPDFDSMTEDELRHWAKGQAQTDEERRQAALDSDEQMRQQAMSDAQRTAGGGGAAPQSPQEYAQKKFDEDIANRVPFEHARARYIENVIQGPPKDVA